MKHSKDATREERLRARASKLCQDVVRPQYLEELRSNYEPHFQRHLARQTAQLASLNAYHTELKQVCVSWVRWSLGAIEATLTLMKTS